MNTTNTKLLLSLATLPLFAVALCAQGGDRDTIFRQNGKHLTRVKIVKIEFDKIAYSKSGKDAEIAVDRITGFRFGSAPDTYNQGLSSAGRNSHASAAKLFDEAAKAAKSDAVKQAATFNSGRSFALAALKDPTHANNAVTQLQAYLAAASNGYFMPEAKVRLAQATLAGGDAAGAETMLATLEGEATANSWPLMWNAQIAFSKGRAQFAQQKWADARNSLQGVDGAVTGALGQDSKHNSMLQALRTEALVMQGETFIGEKLYNDALSYYQGLANNSSRGIKAAAYAGEGQILFIQGADKSDVDKLRQAQLALARASVEPDTSDSTTAKALFYMGKVLTALGDHEKNALARAKTYYTSVKNQYGSTAWGAKARRELEG